MIKKLTKEDLDKMDLSKNDRFMYDEALKVGANIFLLNETKNGYDLTIAFGDLTNFPMFNQH